MTLALIAGGRRAIGYIGQKGREYIDRVNDRHAGYCAALRQKRIGRRSSREVEVDLSFRGGAAGLAELLVREPGVDAVFCSSDVIAAGVLFECQRRGVAVPGHLAITGMDDQEIASQCVPALTTVRMPRYEMGRRAAALLCRRLAGATIDSRTQDLGFEIVVRQTT